MLAFLASTAPKTRSSIISFTTSRKYGMKAEIATLGPPSAKLIGEIPIANSQTGRGMHGFESHFCRLKPGLQHCCFKYRKFEKHFAVSRDLESENFHGDKCNRGRIAMLAFTRWRRCKGLYRLRRCDSNDWPISSCLSP